MKNSEFYTRNKDQPGTIPRMRNWETSYEQTKDKCIQKWYYKLGRHTLEAGVYRYEGGEPKFQVGPRKYNDRIIRIGRLTLDESVWLSCIMDEVIERIESEEDKDDYDD